MTVILVVLALGCGLWIGGRDLGRRGFSEDPFEQGAIGMGLLLALLPLVILIAFAAGIPIRWTVWLWVVPLAAGAVGLVRKRWAFGRVDRWGIGTGALIFFWLIAIQALQPVCDGAGWANDWYEHYQRALFFLHRYPADFAFIGNYILPDRPPNFNLLVASTLPLTGEGYPAYQAVATLLNLLPILPLALLARRWAPGNSSAVTAASTVLLPLFVRMSAYPWTRGLAAFFVLMGIWCYLRGGYGRDRRDALLAFVFLGSACLVHYSSLVAFIPAGLHFLWVTFPTRKGRGTLLRAMALVLLIVLPWGVYLIAVHGAGTGFTNTTTQWTARHGFLGVHRIVLENVLNSLVPPVLYEPVFSEMKDSFFHGVVGYFGNSLPGGLTLAFAISLMTAALTRWKRLRNDRAAHHFWALFIPVSVYLGFLVVPEVNRFVGVAHTCLYPVLLLGVVRAAAWLLTAAPPAFHRSALLLLALENVIFHSAFLFGQSALKAIEGRPVDGITLINLETKAKFNVVFLFDLWRPAWPVLAIFAVVGLLAAFVILFRALIFKAPPDPPARDERAGWDGPRVVPPSFNSQDRRSFEMRPVKLIVPSIMLLAGALFAAAPTAEPVATFSIAARDPATGELGVAVASRFFAVGSVVPWARADSGAVATQAYGNTSFGPRGLDLLERGASPDETLAILLRSDGDRERRQVGIVGADGASVTYTGKGCSAWAGGRRGPNYAVQGNILAGEAVVASMEEAFLKTKGTLADRMYAALIAGDSKGGDSRGKQSAALVVVKAKAGYGGYNDRAIDIRVDDHPEPFVELGRLLNYAQMNYAWNEAWTAFSEKRFPTALPLMERTAVLAPDNGEVFYDLAVIRLAAGKPAEALEALKEAVTLNPKLKKQAAVDDDLKALREDPGFNKLIE